LSTTLQFLALADEELETSKLLLDAKHYRASISRAYYAMYYATQALLLARNLTSRSHKGVLLQFSQYFVKPGDLPASMAKTLSKNYDLRLLSDYEHESALTSDDSTNALVAANDFVIRVRVYLEQDK
jgi:uncharacterized protein (UPF0332 family)